MSPESSRPAWQHRTDGWHVAIALFIFVFFCRAWLILLGGTPVPFWDQWDAEALGLYHPWLTGKLHWSDLLAPHNEHRIALTRLADLALLTITGGWNLWGQLLLNAALHATSAVLLYIFSGAHHIHQRPLRLTILLTLALLLGSPVGWQNALWGFQSQVGFGIVCALLALAAWAGGTPDSQSWRLGCLCVALGFFANGAGLLTIIAALPAFVCGFAAAARPRTQWFTAGMTIAGLLLAGWLLQVRVPQHAALHSQNTGSFFAVLFRCLSWPWVNSPWIWLAMQLPAAWLLGQYVRKRSAPGPTDRFLLSVVLWAMLHAAAIAWSRGGGLPDHRPLSRYQDPLLIGAAANFFIVLNLARQGAFARKAALLWSGLLLTGLVNLSSHALAVNVPYKRLQNSTGLAQIRSYLEKSDPAVLAGETALAPLHPNPDRVRLALDESEIRQILPNEYHDRTATPPWIIQHSPWLTGLALLGLLAAGWNRRIK